MVCQRLLLHFPQGRVQCSIPAPWCGRIRPVAGFGASQRFKKSTHIEKDLADAGSRRSELWSDGVLEVALAGSHEALGFCHLFAVGPGLPKEKFLASCSRFVFLPFFHPHLRQFSRFPAFSWRAWTASAVIFPFSGDLIVSLQQFCDLHRGFWLPRIVLCATCSSYYNSVSVDFLASPQSPEVRFFCSPGFDRLITETCESHRFFWLPRIVLCATCSWYYDNFVSVDFLASPHSLDVREPEVRFCVLRGFDILTTTTLWPASRFVTPENVLCALVPRIMMILCLSIFSVPRILPTYVNRKCEHFSVLRGFDRLITTNLWPASRLVTPENCALCVLFFVLWWFCVFD